MIRVLHIISGLGSGGTEGVLSRLVRSGDPEIASGVVSLTDEGVHAQPLRASGVPVWVARMPRGLPTPGYRKALATAVREFRPDLVCGWLYRGNLAALDAARWADAPVIWNIRHSLHDWANERWLFRLTVRVNRWLARRPEAVVYNSYASRDQHRAFRLVPRSDFVIPNGFDLARFRPNSTARSEWRERWGVQGVVVGLVARWHPAKNHAGFLRAARQTADRVPDAVFVLAGEGCDQDNEELVRLIDQNGLRERVRLLGRVSNVEAVTAALDLAVNASHGEALSNAIGEALACDIPVLATDVGDSARLVGRYGRVVPVEALGDAMAELAALGSSGLAALGHGGRTSLEAGYRLEDMNHRFAQLFRETVSKKRSAS